jgi:hypothetical protein
VLDILWKVNRKKKMLFLNFYLLSKLELDTLLFAKHVSNFRSKPLTLSSEQECHLCGGTTFVLSVGTYINIKMHGVRSAKCASSNVVSSNENRGSPSCIDQLGNDERFLVGNWDIIEIVLNTVWLFIRCSVAGYVFLGAWNWYTESFRLYYTVSLMLLMNIT